MYSIAIMLLSIPSIFMFLNHPISLSMMIFLQVIMVSLACGLMSNLFWFSYMLFLVMIGGLLILFLYMTNVASNEKFKPSKSVKMIFYTTLITMVMLMFLDKFYCYSIISIWKYNYNLSLNLILMKFYNYPSMNMMIIMMIYLLLTMIMTVKLIDIKSGALRQKF